MGKIKKLLFLVFLCSCEIPTGSNHFDPNSPVNLGLLMLGADRVVRMEFSSNKVQPGGTLFISTNHDFTTTTNGLQLPIKNTNINPIKQVIARSKFLYEVRMNPTVTNGKFTLNLKDYYLNESLLVNPETFEFEIDANPPLLQLKTGNGIDISELQTGFLDIEANEEIVWEGNLSQISLSGNAKNSLVVSDVIVTDRNIRLLFAGNPNANGGILTISLDGVKDKASNTEGTVMVPVQVFAFKSGPNMNLSRRSCGAVELDDGRKIVLGGRVKSGVLVNGNGTLSSMEYYNSVTKEFTFGPDMVYRRQEFAIVKLLDGRVLVSGGFGALVGPGTNVGLASIEVFDPNTNTWTEGPSLHSPRQFHKMTVLPDGNVLVVGGINPFGPFQTVSEVELIHVTPDPMAMTVESVGHLSESRSKHAQVLAANAGKVVISGGERSDVTGVGVNDHFIRSVDSIEIYDTNTKTITTSNAKITRRFNHFAHNLSTGEVLILGGISSRFNDGQPILRAQIYNPISDTIRDHKNLLFGREWGSSFVFPYGKDQIMIAGGLEYRTINGNTFDSILDTESWSESSQRFYLTGRSLNARWEGCDLPFTSTGGGMILGGRIGAIVANTEEYSFE